MGAMEGGNGGLGREGEINRLMEKGWVEMKKGERFFLEAIIARFDAVGHQNLIKIYTTF